MTQCTKQFDPTKPCKTRDGKKARIICTDRKSVRDETPILAIFAGAHEKEIHEDVIAYFKCGHRYGYDHEDNQFDLINISDAESELDRVKRELRELNKINCNFRPSQYDMPVPGIDDRELRIFFTKFDTLMRQLDK